MRAEAWPRSEPEFEALFLAHFEGVYRLLYRITGSASEAEDLTQETFLRCFRQAPAVEPPPVRPWLYRVAMHLGFNALRDARRLRERHQRSGPSGPAADPAEEAVREDERNRVRGILKSLPARQAQLLLLRHGGLSYRDVAAALAISPASVGTLLNRAEEAFARAYRAGARQGADGRKEGEEHV